MTNKEEIAKKRLEVIQSISDTTKKFYSPISDSTKKMDKKPLSNFIAELITTPLIEANDLITNYAVTVNNKIIVDLGYELKSGDVVRADIGHFLPNSGYVAIVR